MEERDVELLALLYFHVVFTLPAPLGLGIQRHCSAGDRLACIAGRGGSVAGVRLAVILVQP